MLEIAMSGFPNGHAKFDRRVVESCKISSALQKFLAMSRQIVAIPSKQTCVSGKY
jgi:hypothetical protein